MKRSKLFSGLLLSLLALAVLFSCEDKPIEPVNDGGLGDVKEEVAPAIELLSPEKESLIDLEKVDSVEFAWTGVENANTYKIHSS